MVTAAAIAGMAGVMVRAGAISAAPSVHIDSCRKWGQPFEAAAARSAN